MGRRAQGGGLTVAKRPNRDVVAMLGGWLGEAAEGRITAVLIVGRRPDGEYVEAWVAEDLADMVCELRGTVIRAQLDA